LRPTVVVSLSFEKDVELELAIVVWDDSSVTDDDALVPIVIVTESEVNCTRVDLNIWNIPTKTPATKLPCSAPWPAMSVVNVPSVMFPPAETNSTV